MKAIYTFINGKVFKVKQNTTVPTSLTFRVPGCSSTVSSDRSTQSVSQTIFVNTLKKPGTKSNAEMYANLVDFLSVNKVTEIPEIQNRFKIYIDYSIYDGLHEVDHSVVIKPIEAIDQAVLLGVATNNECVFRRVKTFKNTTEFKIHNTLPHGIMNTTKKDYRLKINNVAIFQDLANIPPEVHNSTYSTPYAIGSSTVQSSLSDMLLIYSTENDGIELQDVAINFVPRNVSVIFEIVLADYTVAYNDADITKVLVKNLEEKYPSKPPKDDDIDSGDTGSGGIMIPDEDNNPDADGDYEPDEDGYYQYYEKCKETTPKGLLVVEDLIPDGSYDITSMIRISKVIADIDDIQVGDYVILREVIRTNM